MHLKFAELPVKDQDRALAFYTERLGMTVADDADYGGGWRWIELTMPDAQTALLMTKSTGAERPDSPTLVFVVDDVEALHARLVEAGTEIRQAPTVAPWDPTSTSALFYDSEDNLISIVSVSARSS